jgi:hypothetical protein
MVDERDPWEHDAGPTTASGWAALVGETPNQRGLGQARSREGTALPMVGASNYQRHGLETEGIAHASRRL